MSRNDLEVLRSVIRNHPDFPQAMRRYVAELIEWRGTIGVINRVIGNIARLRILENLMYLHYAPPLAQGGKGASFERLAQLSQTYDGIGARAVRTALRLAQIAGLVSTTRDARDGRLRVFQATVSLVSQARQFLALTIRPLDSVFPDLRLDERFASDPDFFFVTVAALGRIYLEREIRFTSPESPLYEFIRLEGAVPISAVVLDCFWKGYAVPPAAELSRRFLTSESQARAVLKAAEAAGLIRIGPRGVLLDADPLAQSLFDQRARVLAFCALCLLEAPGK